MKNTFKWLNISQFTGSFNDNAFKMTTIIALVNLLGHGQKEDLAHLRNLITGGEKLRPERADHFNGKLDLNTLKKQVSAA
ncbi:MAG: hypothetical protein GXY61_09815 [Lentisphaerae bacterium]|nr:hypothetical protein [Lentisphaerota bacterium]